MDNILLPTSIASHNTQTDNLDLNWLDIHLIHFNQLYITIELDLTLF